jgi:hypothetical protein
LMVLVTDLMKEADSYNHHYLHMLFFCNAHEQTKNLCNTQAHLDIVNRYYNCCCMIKQVDLWVMETETLLMTDLVSV